VLWFLRSILVIVIAIAGAGLLAPVAVFAATAAGEEPRKLDPGTVLEQGFQGGESHVYLVEVRPGQPLLVTVDQRGIDVATDVLGPDGKSLGVVDTPTGREGPESVLIEGEGPYRVEIRGPKTALPGRYEVRLEALPQDTPAGRGRVEAERLTPGAERLRRQGTAEAAWQAAARYAEAAGRWRSLGRRREEATALYILATLHGALGDARQAVAAYRQSLPVWEELGDTNRQADVLTALGLAHYALGDDQEARGAFERSIALRRERGDRAGEASSLNNLCLLYPSQGKLDEALACYQQALGLFREAGEAGGEARSLTNLGGLYEILGEPRQALENYGQALDLMVSLGDRRGEAQILNNLGVTSGGLGELGEALARYHRALAIFRELGDRQWEARTLHNLGSVYSALGELQRARATFEQTLELRRAVGDRRGEVVTLNQLGLVRSGLGETAEAQGLFRQARDLARTLGDRRYEADSLGLLGRELIRAGDAGKALEALGEAADILAALGERRPRAVALHRLGQALFLRGDLPKAREAFSQALELRLAIADRAGEAETRTALARLEARLGRIPEARAQVEKTLALIESLRVTLTNPDLRASFLSAYRQAFELEIDLLMRQGQAREALEVSERARARALLDLLQEARASVQTGGDPELRAREKALTERLNAKAERQTEQLSRTGTARAADESELQALLTEMDGVRAEIRRRSPRYAALTQPAPLAAAEIQALLDPQTLLLEYSLGEERSFLWAVDTGTVASFELPPRAEIEAAARRVYTALRTLDPGAAKQGRAEAEALSRVLLGPVADRLASRRLVIVADGALHYLPFAALPVPGVPAGGTSADLLLDRHEIVALPSVSVLASLRRDLATRVPAPKAVAVLADPVFDLGDPRISKTQTAASSRAPERGGEPDFPTLQRLPSTRLEAERISALVPAGEALVELDFAADREAVLGSRLAPYRVVHFATHGLIDARTPELSGLMLSRVGEDGKPKEGFLSLADVYNLQLGADLVVLSGCETALGREVRGEGLVGLTRGFLYAGAARVAASLWRVQDRATAELMGRFYRAMLQEGKSPAAALREAQLAIRSDRRWRAPYYWAAFVLQGDWRDTPRASEIAPLSGAVTE
jgi:CHAT domain-containing protein/Tfp pilus assembly protein PilF